MIYNLQKERFRFTFYTIKIIQQLAIFLPLPFGLWRFPKYKTTTTTNFLYRVFEGLGVPRDKRNKKAKEHGREKERKKYD